MYIYLGWIEVASVTVFTPLLLLLDEPFTFVWTVRALAMHAKNTSKIPVLWMSKLFSSSLLSLLLSDMMLKSDGGKEATPRIDARVGGLTSGNTLRKSDVT